MLAVVAILVRGFIWGILSNIIAHIPTNAAAAAAIVNLTGSTIEIGYCLWKRYSLRATIQTFRLRRLILLATMEITATVCYYQALRWSPLGPAQALSLIAPVIIIVAKIVAGQRRLDARSVASCVFILAAVIVMGLTRHTGNASHVWWGMGAAIVSAAAVAVYAVGFKGVVGEMPAAASSGVLGFSAGLLASRAIVQSPPPPQQLIILAGVGVAVVIPALCYAYGLKHLSVTATSSLELLQPFWGAAIAYLVFGQPVVPAQMVAVPLIVAGVYLELRAPAPVPEPALSPA
jgi:drug/metabolite transporter (DMT)-like permease